MVYEVVVTALWVMLPAYLPNNAAVVFGGGRPIDGGRTLGDRRLLGDGKTWRGAVAGILTGVVFAIGLNAIVADAGTALGVSLPSFVPAAIVGLPTGAILGDITASFLKRRTGRERGAPFPGVDQLDFVIGAMVVTAIVGPGWFTSVFTLPVIVAVLVVTPLLHVGANVFAYRIGVKDEPW